MSIPIKETDEIIGVPAEDEAAFVCSECGTRQSLFAVPLMWDARVVARLLGVTDETLRKESVRQGWKRHFRLKGRSRILVRQYTASEIRHFAKKYRTEKGADVVSMTLRHANADARKQERINYRLAGVRH